MAMSPGNMDFDIKWSLFVSKLVILLLNNARPIKFVVMKQIGHH